MRVERVEHLSLVVDVLVHQHPRLAGDLFQIDTHTWAIHGFIPVDGEVILAEFDHPDTARTLLEQLAAAQELEGHE